jgi:hypothetical protein
MNYLSDITEHPQEAAIKQRVTIIEFSTGESGTPHQTAPAGRFPGNCVYPWVMVANSNISSAPPYRNNCYRGSIIIPGIHKPMPMSNGLIGPSENNLFASMTIS